MVAQAMPVTSAVTLCYPAPVLGPETTWDMVTSAPWFQVVMKWILYHYGSLLAAKLFLSRYNILGPVVKTRPCLGSGVSGLCPLPINVVWYSSLFAFVEAQNRSTVHIINLRVMRETKQLFHFVEQLDARWVESIIYLVNQKNPFLVSDKFYGTDFPLMKTYHQFCFYGCIIYGGTDSPSMISLWSCFAWLSI